MLAAMPLRRMSGMPTTRATSAARAEEMIADGSSGSVLSARKAGRSSAKLFLNGDMVNQATA